MRYIAFITKGLEHIAIDELHHAFPNAVEIVEVGDKRVAFDTMAPPEALAGLRTVDDLCLLAAKMEPVQGLEDLLATARSLDLDRFRALVGEHRPLTHEFSITTTTAGVKGFTALQLAEALRSAVAARYQWPYSERDHSNFDLRVFIDRAVGYLAVRLTAQSLMHRSYKATSKPGSLRPTVAAAMVYLATGRRAGLSVVDTFCGSGTILCEAAAIGCKVAGSDIDPESVAIAASNLRNVGASPEPQVRVFDATKTRWPDAAFDCAISNLPWGKQIALASVAGLFDGAMKEFARIVRRDGVVCALTPHPEPFAKYARKHMRGCRVRAVPVSFTGQSPTIIVIERS